MRVGSTGDVRGRVALGTIGATCDFDGALGNIFALTTGASNVTATPKNLKAGRRYYCDVTQGAAARTLTIGTATVVGAAPAFPAVASARTVIGFDCIDETGPVIAVAGGGLVSEASIVQAPSDAALILQGGTDTGAGTSGTSMKEDTRINLGKLNTGTSVSAKASLTHPDFGSALDFQLRGTPGTPDTANTLEVTCPATMSALTLINLSAALNLKQQAAGSIAIWAHTAGSAVGFFAGAGATPKVVVTQAGLVTIGGAAADKLALANLTQTTVGAAGGGDAQPATPAGYLVVTINGTDRAIPFHLVS